MPSNQLFDMEGEGMLKLLNGKMSPTELEKHRNVTDEIEKRPYRVIGSSSRGGASSSSPEIRGGSVRTKKHEQDQAVTRAGERT